MFTHTQKHSVCVRENINGNSSGSSNSNANHWNNRPRPGWGDGMIYILTHRWAKNEPAKELDSLNGVSILMGHVQSWTGNIW